MKYLVITPYGTEQIDAEDMADAIDYVYMNMTSDYDYITIAKCND